MYWRGGCTQQKKAFAINLRFVRERDISIIFFNPLGSPLWGQPCFLSAIPYRIYFSLGQYNSVSMMASPGDSEKETLELDGGPLPPARDPSPSPGLGASNLATSPAPFSGSPPPAPPALGKETTMAVEGPPPSRIRGRISEGHLLTPPVAPPDGDESDGDTEGRTHRQRTSEREKASYRINLAQSFKSLRSAFSSRSSRAPQEAQPAASIVRPEAATQGLRLTHSMMPEKKEYKEPARTRILKWITYRIRMESFFAVYSLWTLHRALVSCATGMIVFLCLGITLIVLNDKHVECKLNYEEYSLGDGGTRYECLPITTDSCGPGSDIKELDGDEIFVYYELENFNQNGGQIVWNRSERQLAGHIFTDPADVKECEPFATQVIDNVKKVLHPCGALAWRVFNDNFLFFDTPPDGPGGQGSVKALPLMQTTEDILPSNRWRSLYKNPTAQEREAARDRVYFWMSVEDNDDGRDGRGKPEEGLAWAIHEALNFEEAGMMVENSHFIQWMEVAALPTFRKLYGKLKGPLRLPLYAYISINYDVKPWAGKKAVILVVPSVFYGRTLYLGIAYLVFGSILLLFSLYLLWRLHLSKDGMGTGDIRWKNILTRNKRKSK